MLYQPDPFFEAESVGPQITFGREAPGADLQENVELMKDPEIAKSVAERSAKTFIQPAEVKLSLARPTPAKRATNLRPFLFAGAAALGLGVLWFAWRGRG